MTTQETVLWIGVIVTINSLLITLLNYRLQKRAENRRSLVEHMTLYYSPEIQSGTARLWQLYRDSNNDLDTFLQKYIDIWKDEENNNMPINERLHYLRRRVEYFWRVLGILMMHGLIPRHIVYNWLAQDDVDIVDRFLISLENRISRRIGVAELKPEIDPLYWVARNKHRFYRTTK